MKIALFVFLGKPYDPVKTKNRPCDVLFKERNTNIEESIYY